MILICHFNISPQNGEAFHVLTVYRILLFCSIKLNSCFGLFHIVRHKVKERSTWLNCLNILRVDVFGKCGNFTPKCGSHKDYSCTNSMMKGYKFYFVAENSICKEYFTGNNTYLQCSNSLYNLYPLKTDFGIFFI